MHALPNQPGPDLAVFEQQTSCISSFASGGLPRAVIEARLRRG